MTTQPLQHPTPAGRIPLGARLLFILAGVLLALSLCVYAVRAQELPPGQVGGSICFPSLLPLSGAASRAVNSEPALNEDGERAAFWSTADPVSLNSDRSVEVFLADTTNLTNTQPGFSPISQVTVSNGNILGGFNLMPDVVTWVDGGGTLRTFVVLASDRDLVPGQNPDGGFEIFLVRTGTAPLYYQLTQSSRSASLLPTISNVFDSSKVAVAYVSDADAREVRPAAKNDDRNAEIHVMVIDLADLAGETFKNIQITNTGAEVQNDQPAISASGAQVTFLSNGKSGLVASPNNADGNREVFLARIAGLTIDTPVVSVVQVTATPVQIVNDRPDVSSDGRRIVFSSNATNLANAANPEADASVFTASYATSTSTTPVFKRLSAGLKVVTGRTTTAKEPAINSDGGRIVFAADACDPDLPGECAQEAGVFQIFVAEERSTGGGEFIIAQVTTQVTRTFESPAISGDGSSIAIVTSPEASRDNPDLSGSEVVLLSCRVSALAAVKEFDIVSPSLSPERPDVGDIVDYLVSVDNSSLTSFDGVMTVTDTLPAGVTWISSAIAAQPVGTNIVLPPGPPSPITRRIIWTVTDLAKAQRATVRIRVRINSGQAGSNPANLVTMSSPEAEELVDEGLITFDGEDQVEFFVTKVDLRARIVVSKNIPRENELFDYTVTISNAVGMDPATNVALTTTLPLLPLTYVNVTPSVGTYNPTTGVWSIPQLDGGVMATLKLTANAPAGTGGSAPMVAQLTGIRSDQEDINVGNNLDVSSRTIRVLGTDLELVSKTVNVARPPIGTNVVYTIVVRNRGPLPNSPDPATDTTYTANAAAFVPATVTVRDPLPAGLTFLSASDAGALVGPDVVWSLSEPTDWVAGLSKTLTFTATVTAAPETVVTNRVGAIEARFPLPENALMNDPVPANNAPANIFAQLTVNSPQDVAVSVQPSPDAIQEGKVVTASVRFTDADQLDTHQIVLNWGDGAPSVTVPNIVRPANQLWYSRAFTHTYADDDDNDSYTVVATVSDSFNQSGSAQANVTVTNVRPTAVLTTVTQFARRFGNAYVVTTSAPLRFSTSFSDPGFSAFGGLESFAFAVNWGDGPQTATIAVPSGNVVNGSPGVNTTGSVTVQHQYVTYGTFSAALLLGDDDMAAPEQVTTVAVIVNDPPVAFDDALTVVENITSSVAVLVNDNALGLADTMVVTDVVTTGTLGTVVIVNGATGVISYTAGSAFDSLAAGQTAADVFDYVITDTVGFSDIGRVNVTVQGVNDPPVLDLNGAGGGVNTTATYVEDQDPVTLAPALTLIDVDTPNLQEARVLIVNMPDAGQETLVFGSTEPLITVAYTPTQGLLVLTGPAPVAAFRTVLASIAYENTSQSPTAGDRTVAYGVRDIAGALFVQAQVTLSVEPRDDPPVVTTSAGATSATEGQAPVAVDAGIVITDVDSPIFNGGALTVTVQSADANKDNLTILNGGGIVVSGSNVSYNGFAIGTAAGLDTPRVIVTFNSASATVAAVQALARQIAYDRDNGSSPDTRTIAFSVRSSAGGVVSNTATKVVSLIATNDQPVVTITIFSVTEDTPLDIDSNYTIADSDAGSGQLVMTVTVSSGTLTFTGLPATGNGTTQVVVAGSLTQLNNDAVNVLTYDPNDNYDVTDTLTINVNDQGNFPPPATTSGPTSLLFDILPVNDAPTLDLNTGTGGTGSTATFTEGGSAVNITSPTLDIADIDSPNMFSATVRITNLQNPGLEILTATSSNPNITPTYNAATGVLSIISTAQPIADFEAVLRSVTYENTSQAPGTTARAVAFVVRDAGGLDSNVATATVTVQAVNDPPAIFLSPNATGAQESGPAVIIDATSVVSDLDTSVFANGQITLTVVDASNKDVLFIRLKGEDANSPFTIGGSGGNTVFHNNVAFTSFVQGDGLLRFTGMNANATLARLTDLLRWVTYQRTPGPTVTSRTINYVIREANLQTAGLATKTITLGQFNDPPVVTIAPFTPVEETLLSIGGFITVNDPDALAGTLVMTASVTNGRLSAVTVLPVSGNNTNRIVIQGTLTDMQVLLSTSGGLNYQGNNNFAGADQLVVTVNDQGNTPFPAKVGSATGDFTVSPVNDAPVISIAPIAAVEDTNLSLNSRIAFTDVDAAGGTLVMTLTVTQGTLDVTLVSGVTGLAGDNTNRVRFQGNQINLRNLLNTVNGIVYRGASNFFGNDSLTVQINDQGNTPLPALVGTQSLPFAVAAVNDAPTLGVNNGITVTVAATPTVPTTATITSAALQYNDVDNPANAVVYTVVATPAIGIVQLSGVTRQPCSVNLATAGFTQDDINQNRLTYSFNSAVRPINDTMTLVVGNAANCAAAQLTLNLRVRAP